MTGEKGRDMYDRRKEIAAMKFDFFVNRIQKFIFTDPFTE